MPGLPHGGSTVRMPVSSGNQLTCPPPSRITQSLRSESEPPEPPKRHSFGDERPHASFSQVARLENEAAACLGLGALRRLRQETASHPTELPGQPVRRKIRRTAKKSWYTGSQTTFLVRLRALIN